MTDIQKLAVMKDRLKQMQGRGDKNIKCGGCVKKLARQIRNMEKNI